MVNFMICFTAGYAFVSFFDIVYMQVKERKLKLEFSKKLKEKGYKKVDDDFDLFSQIYFAVVDRNEYAGRVLTSIFPITNLYTFSKIIRKQLDKEYNTALDSVDNEEVLNILEENKHIYGENTISERISHIENKVSKINENNNNQVVVVDKNDSLETLTEKRELLNEMIYLRNLQELEKNNASQETEEEQETAESVKPLKLVKNLFKVDKSKKTE